ncbi:SLC44A2_4_5 [Mytilus edulis]|uniref:SLC44A2_4_5 n=1 Tax=Mytilus edulis TaxID=6550 RepID=A0A8S3TM58_MYTED|nr:SLC44A2_4_5 [Mytilus edulis]
MQDIIYNNTASNTHAIYYTSQNKVLKCIDFKDKLDDSWNCLTSRDRLGCIIIYTGNIEKMSKTNKVSPENETFQYDPDFEGPIKNRSCTDIICCLLFIIFIGGLAIISYFAFKYGDPSLLLNPVNSDGEMCGKGNQEGKDYLFFFDMVTCGRMGVGVFVKGCPTPQICVSQCPDANFIYKPEPLGDGTQFNSVYCKDSYASQSLSDIIDQEIFPNII